MEWLAIALTGFLALFSPVNLIGDKLIADNIRSRVHDVEELSVRVDNAPNFGVVQGKVQRLRIASRGLEVIPAVRIEQVQLETDPIDVNWRSLSGGSLRQLRQALRQPLQGATEVVITEADINEALENAQIQTRLERLLNQVIPDDAPRFQLLAARLDFLEDNRLMIAITLSQGSEAEAAPETLEIEVETGIQIEQGSKLSLINPVARLNDRKISSRIVNSIVGSFDDRLDLQPFEFRGVTARVIRYALTPDQLAVSTFFSLAPESIEQ